MTAPSPPVATVSIDQIFSEVRAVHDGLNALTVELREERAQRNAERIADVARHDAADKLAQTRYDDHEKRLTDHDKEIRSLDRKLVLYGAALALAGGGASQGIVELLKSMHGG